MDRMIEGAAIFAYPSSNVMGVRDAIMADLSVEYGKPLGLGISGPGETRLQAQDRIENAANAVRAVVKMVERVRELRS